MKKMQVTGSERNYWVLRKWELQATPNRGAGQQAALERIEGMIDQMVVGCEVTDCENCHNAEGVCLLTYIKDCEEHYRNCADDCHSECACQDRG